MIQQNSVVFSCEDFLVLNKPVGLSVQCEAGQPGCIALLKSQLKVEQLHPVHRLDKVTSGLLLVARNALANQRLSQLFQRGEIEKYYYALSAKRPSKKQGSVIGDMVQARSGGWKLLRSCNNPAVTQFFTCGAQGLRVFTLKPHTGKTHQLRVALKSLGAPILGDQRYGGLQADRVYLHAAALRFQYAGLDYDFFQPPDTGEFFESAAVSELLQGLGHPKTRCWPKMKSKRH